MKSDDELLDEIAAHLRDERVPPMPDVPLTFPAPAASRRGLWAAVAATALAASIAGLLWWRMPPAELTPPGRAPGGVQPNIVHTNPIPQPSANVVRVNVDLAAPLTHLEARLDALDAELAQLRREAELLDARRKADRLLAQWP